MNQVPVVIVGWVGVLPSGISAEAYLQLEPALDSILQSGAEVLVLSLPEIEQDDLLKQLRASPVFATRFIAVCGASALSPYLASGLFDQSFDEQLAVHQARKLPSEYSDDPVLKAVRWLWQHPQACIKPRTQASSAVLYDYPLLQCWGITPQQSVPWLARLARKGWIEKNELVNRVRLCARCDQGHLNYLDVCPSCEQMDIETQVSLHCFNCGHVGDQRKFSRSAGLSCPNCQQVLRHIGVDYDRPIENQICRSCHALFSEAKVVAQCLSCGCSNAVDSLKVRKFYSYGLTPEGARLASVGWQINQMALEVGEKLPLTQFYWQISWLNQLAIRHKHQHTLVYIEILNLQSLISDMGESKGLELVDGLQKRLVGMMRTTDACTSHLADGLLMLLPFTAAGNTQLIQTKLQHFLDQHASTEIKLRFRTLSLPADIGDDVSSWLSNALASVSHNT